VPLKDLLASATLLNGAGAEVSMQQAVEGKRALALYFSAHWCPPCRGFTPKLAEWYKKDLAAKGLEVVFVSSDRDEESFKGYFAEQPWLALKYEDRKLKEKLSAALKVEGIPALVILDAELNVVNTDGRSAVTSDPEGAELPWHPKPVKDLKDGPGDINEVPTLLVLCETSEQEEQKRLQQELEPLASKYIETQKATDDDLEVAFAIGTAAEGVATRVRELLSLPAVNGARLAPRMALLDIPDNGGYYLAEEGAPVSAAAAEQFLADYKAGKLDRKQLS
jgi:nucleoredoxin